MLVAEAKRAHSLCREDGLHYYKAEAVEHVFSQEESITVRMISVKNTLT